MPLALHLSSGFRVQGAGFRVQGSGFRVQGSGFRVQGQGSGFKVQAGFNLALRLEGVGRAVVVVSQLGARGVAGHHSKVGAG